MSEDILNFLNERYPVVLQKIEAVSDGMYRCYGNQGIYYARIGQYRTYEEQLEEVQWTNFLYEQGVGVSPAIASVNGHEVETMLPGMHMYWDQRKLSEEQVRLMNLYRIRIEQDHPVIGW